MKETMKAHTFYPGRHSRYSNGLRAGQPILIPGKAKDLSAPMPFLPVLGSIRLPVQLILGTFPQGKAAGA
jgi:hypothetical protein